MTTNKFGKNTYRHHFDILSGAVHKTKKRYIFNILAQNIKVLSFAREIIWVQRAS